jgi:hypothetical protein
MAGGHHGSGSGPGHLVVTGPCRSVVEAAHAFYRSGRGRDDLRVGMVVPPQRFGDKVNPDLHLHALATDGAFDAGDVFHPKMPESFHSDVTVDAILHEVNGLRRLSAGFESPTRSIDSCEQSGYHASQTQGCLNTSIRRIPCRCRDGMTTRSIP